MSVLCVPPIEPTLLSLPPAIPFRYPDLSPPALVAVTNRLLCILSALPTNAIGNGARPQLENRLPHIRRPCRDEACSAHPTGLPDSLPHLQEQCFLPKRRNGEPYHTTPDKERPTKSIFRHP